MLLWSTSGLAISLSVFGAYQHVMSINPNALDFVRWLPLVCLFFFMITFETGIGPLPWLLLPEMVPVRVRGVISGIGTFILWLGFFGISRFFYLTKECFG